jgi:hypothetical protein
MRSSRDRTFRRYIERYQEEGLEGLADKRLIQASTRKAPVDEVVALVGCYKAKYRGWNAKHFHSWYRREVGERSYTRVKSQLQQPRRSPRPPGVALTIAGASVPRCSRTTPRYPV